MQHHAIRYTVPSSGICNTLDNRFTHAHVPGLQAKLCPRKLVCIVQDHGRAVDRVVCEVTDNGMAETHAVHAQLVPPPGARE
jgi:hypothetical protein